MTFLAASQLAATQAEAAAAVAAGEKISQAKQDEIKKLQESAAAKAEDAAKSLAAAEAARIHAAATETSTLAYADNSKRVQELRAAWSDATTAATVLHAELAAGRATRQQVIEADTAAGQAARLYRDALADTAAAIQARAAVEKSAITMQERGRSLQLEVIQTQIDVAKARGRDNEVAQLQMEYSRVQMELSGLKAKALRAEAEAQLALIAAKRAELEASGQMTEVKRLELLAAEQSAKAKQIDAQVAEELASRARQLADVVRTSKDSMDDATGAADKLGESWGSAADKADRLALSASKAGRAAKSIDGTTNPDGTVNRYVNSAAVDAYAMGIENGLNDKQAKKLQEIYGYYINKGNAQAKSQAAGTLGLGFNAADYAAITRDMANQAMAEAKRQVAAEEAAAASSGNSQSRSSGFQFGSRNVITVNINTPSGTKTVNTADQASADALVKTLKELAAVS